MNRVILTSDLRASERAFVAAMQRLSFGRFEFLRIDSGELVLDPWPTTVRGVKFAAEEPSTPRTPPDEFELKRQVIELLEYIRAVEAGEIRCLEIRHGLPFSMEVELAGAQTKAAEGSRRG
jgi:hypothetical protein